MQFSKIVLTSYISTDCQTLPTLPLPGPLACPFLLQFVKTVHQSDTLSSFDGQNQTIYQYIMLENMVAVNNGRQYIMSRETQGYFTRDSIDL